MVSPIATRSLRSGIKGVRNNFSAAKLTDFNVAAQ